MNLSKCIGITVSPFPDQTYIRPYAKAWSQHSKEKFAENHSKIQVEYAAREVAALKNENLSCQGRKQLLAILRMIGDTKRPS